MFSRKHKQSLYCHLESELWISIFILQYGDVDFSTEIFIWLCLSPHINLGNQVWVFIYIKPLSCFVSYH